MLGSCRNIKELRGALYTLPKGVDAMYIATMERIKSQEDPSIALHALTWLVHTLQPLKMNELLHAIAVNPETFEFDPELFIDHNTLLSLCCGLITFEPESKQVRLVRESNF